MQKLINKSFKLSENEIHFLLKNNKEEIIEELKKML